MSFFGVPQTARRRAAGTYADGLWVEGIWEALDVVGTIQPLSGKEMDSLPEGRRERASYVLITTTPMRGVEPGTNPDEVLAFGAWCEVYKCEPWQSGILPHYRCILQKLNDPPAENPEPEP